jgi:hypothetical protein
MKEQDWRGPAHDPQEQEPTGTVEPRSSTELVLLCSSRRVESVIAGLTKKAEQIGEILLPAEVYWDGRTRKRFLGVIVLTGTGSIPPAFLEQLDRDPEILDYFVAPRECSGDHPATPGYLSPAMYEKQRSDAQKGSDL